MSNIIDTTNKSAFLYSESIASEVKRYCEPLTQCFGVRSFSYLKIFYDCSYLYLMNGFSEYRRSYFENIEKQGKIISNFMQRVPIGEPFYYLWPKYLPQEPPFVLFKKYNIFNGFTVFYRLDDCIETFSFAFDKNSEQKANFFFENLHLLTYFTKIFKLQASNLIDCGDKSKLAIYKKTFDIGFKVNPEKQSIKKLLLINNPFMLNNKKTLFSNREIQCLEELSNGKTAKQIGRFLNLSPRTIESYIEHAKNKVGCNYKSQLIDIYLHNKTNIHAKNLFNNQIYKKLA